jgi:drug/metabolite transporter (DMT)-like permease
MDARTALLTALTMAAFAANSVLCRMALGRAEIDPAAFTAVRLISGAATLLLLVLALGRSRPRAAPVTARQETGLARWISPFELFLYAVCFSFAYLSLTAGTGALILFGAVQATMIAAGLLAGERPRLTEWLGLAVAIGGLVYLVSPGLAAPPLVGSGLMALAGVSWGLYSLRGRRAADPVAATTGNFARAVPFALVVATAWLPRMHFTGRGLLLAVLSGAVASGLGYVLWYAALRGLTATRAAIVQLSVPVLAALGGVALLGETVSLRLALSAVGVLGGVGLSISATSPRPAARAATGAERRDRDA